MVIAVGTVQGPIRTFRRMFRSVRRKNDNLLFQLQQVGDSFGIQISAESLL